jgi:hypothetical protein
MGLKRRTFQAFLEKVDAKCKDLLCHTEICSLSHGKVLQLFVVLKEEVTQFLENDRKVPRAGK